MTTPEPAPETAPERNRLPVEAQLWAVTRLACFVPPKQVLKEITEAWGVQVTPQALTYYDPGTAAGQQLRPELRELFEQERKDYLADVTACPAAHQAFRVQELYRLYLANREKSPVVAASLLEQLSKETGGLYTNRRELTGANGGPVQGQQAPPDFSALSIEELQSLASILSKTAPAPAGGDSAASPDAAGSAGGASAA
jgi:hypothetical protein